MVVSEIIDNFSKKQSLDYCLCSKMKTKFSSNYQQKCVQYYQLIQLSDHYLHLFFSRFYEFIQCLVIKKKKLSFLVSCFYLNCIFFPVKQGGKAVNSYYIPFISFNICVYINIPKSLHKFSVQTGNQEKMTWAKEFGRHLNVLKLVFQLTGKKKVETKSG